MQLHLALAWMVGALVVALASAHLADSLAGADTGGDCGVLLVFATQFSNAAAQMAWDLRNASDPLWCCHKTAGVACDGDRVIELELAGRGITGSVLHLSRGLHFLLLTTGVVRAVPQDLCRTRWRCSPVWGASTGASTCGLPWGPCPPLSFTWTCKCAEWTAPSRTL